MGARRFSFAGKKEKENNIKTENGHCNAAHTDVENEKPASETRDHNSYPC
jgi:hypothetical protein